MKLNNCWFQNGALVSEMCVQQALLSAGYDDIFLKVKQVICLEILYLKKDLVAVLPAGYGNS